MAEPYIEGLIMNMTMETMWPLWAIAGLLAIACRRETIIALSGLPWWQRVLATVAAVVGGRCFSRVHAAETRARDRDSVSIGSKTEF
jgi:hypothetical protein